MARTEEAKKQRKIAKIMARAHSAGKRVPGAKKHRKAVQWERKKKRGK